MERGELRDLKAEAYDVIVQLEQLRARLGEINRRIMEILEAGDDAKAG